tara:strand:- start:161 stop:1201 length:1041 start_codon:yes stop_codon:yes gene_type:complete
MNESSRPARFAKHALAIILLGLSTACSDTAPKPRLDQVKNRGFVTCGIWPGIAGFSTIDEQGWHHGIDIEVCRALSAAIFGSPDNVQYVRAENVQQLREDDDLDIVSRRITWSLTRAAANDLMFGPIIFYDGQGFLVPKQIGITSADQLSGTSVCVQTVEKHAATLAAYTLENDINLTSVPIENNDDVKQAFEAGRCSAYSADISLLGAAKLELGDSPEYFLILPTLISKEPLAPLVRRGDDQFFEVLRWTIFAMIAAEEFGITSANIDDKMDTPSPEIRRLLGVIPGNGAALGLDEDWAYNVIKTVGNYGEMFDRNVGRNSSIKLDRGPNRLWTNGGLMYAPRLR